MIINTTATTITIAATIPPTINLIFDFGLFVGAGATGVVDEAGVAGKADEVGAAFTPPWVPNGAVVPAGVVDVADGMEVDDIVGVAEVVGTTGVTGVADCGPPNGLVGLTGLVEPFGCTGFGCGLGWPNGLGLSFIEIRLLSVLFDTEIII